MRLLLSLILLTCQAPSKAKPLTIFFITFSSFDCLFYNFFIMKMKIKMKGRTILLLLVILLGNIIQFSSMVVAIRMELIHRHSPRLNPRPMTQLERIKELLHNDIIRQNKISHKRQSSSVAVEMPLQAGRDYGTGMYLVEIKVGTPSQKFRLIVDTGSEFSWMSCRYRCGDTCTKKGRIDGRRVFKADLSSSFKTVPCSSEMCKTEFARLFSLNRCPTPTSPCAYDYRYTDGSGAIGIFGKETVTLGLKNGRKTRIEDVVIGCSDTIQGQTIAKADGVLGLSYDKYSFAQKVTKSFGGNFSYCLVDHLTHKNVSDYLIFGGNESSMRMRYTLLGLIGPDYAVSLKGVSIGGLMLNIPIEVWDFNRGGGTAIDSGTSLTFLTEPAYKPVMGSLESCVSRYQRVKRNGIPMEYCFNSTGFDESSVPKLVFHFVDGARFEPHWKSYIIDVADGIKCLGFVSAKWPGASTIGNIMQQNYFWEFDLIKSKLGFAPSTCT